MVVRMRSPRLVARALGVIVALAVLLPLSPGASAAPSVSAACLEYTGDQFSALFDTAQLPNLRKLDPAARLCLADR